MRFSVSRGCTYCGTCVLECPVGAITLRQDGARIDHQACTGCGACRENCASEAIVPAEAAHDTGESDD